MELLDLIGEYQRYLKQNNVLLDSEGFPLMRREWYLEIPDNDEWPKLIIPFRDRKSSLVLDPSHTVLCFYCADNRIYPRLEQVLIELDEYRQFMGVIGADVTITEDMDIECQQATILLNQLFGAVLAVNGIKIVQNLRIGLPSTLRCLLNVPEDIMCASGTLGCELTEDSDYSYAVKLHTLKPSRVMLYGRYDTVMEQQLNAAGVPHRWYKDAHTLYKQQKRAITKIQQVIKQRRENLDEDNVMLDKAWHDMVEACAQNISATVAFITNECSVDDMNYLSEVFDELIYQAQSPELVSAIAKASFQYPDSDKQYFLKVLSESVSDCGNLAVQSAYCKAKENRKALSN
ncbi:DUF4417 domain-containing protein [Bifidobacterium olomucense]|uniref:Uncharacterized protein n=1 Tax=Bifidobacterium olomucense TaxID=2675324 RepID=A0A7Y0EYF6_9BIFI|nr:DUF4417 domain-containing protein [Bifidobacterium sp. DSM 109959]NMM98699.1 hypothetical protein [Bifidobacterium sp. DSM 109959]